MATQKFDPVALGAVPVKKSATFDPLALGAKQISTKRVGSPGSEFPTTEFGRKVSETAKAAVDAGSEALGKTAEGFAKGTPAEKVANVFRAPMQAVGTGARVAFAPISVAIGDAIEGISNMPMAQRIAMSDKAGALLDKMDDTGVALGDWAKSNPQFAGDVQDFIDTISLAIGPKAVKPVVRATERVAAAVESKIPKNAFARSGVAAEEAASKVDGVTTKILSGALKKETGAMFDEEAAAAFKRYGIQPPISAVTSSRVVAGAEGALQSAWWGGAAVAKIVDDARMGIFKVADSLKRSVDPEALKVSGVTPESVGRTLQEAVATVKREFETAKSKLYDAADSQIGTQQAKLDATRATLERIASELGQSAVPTAKAEATFFQKMLGNLSDAKKRTYANIKATRTDIGKKIAAAQRGGPVDGGDVGRLKAIYASLSDDLEATIRLSGPDAASAFDTATAYYKAGIEKLNAVTARTIWRSKSPETIVGKIIKPGEVSQVRELKALVGPEAFEQVSSLFLNNLINSVVVPLTGKINPRRLAEFIMRHGDDQLREILGERGFVQLKGVLKGSIADDILEKGTVEGRVLPGRLANAIESYDEKVLREVFSPEELQKLKDVRTMSGAMARGTKIVEGSPTAEKLQTTMNVLLGVTNVPTLLAKLAIEFQLTKLFTTPWGRKILTRGRIGGKSKAGAAKGGGEAAMAAKEANVAPEANLGQPEGGTITRYSEVPADRTATGKVSRETSDAPAGKPLKFTLYRGIGKNGANDYGAAGKGEYFAGRKEVAEVYAKDGGEVIKKEITLKNALELTYPELNALQEKVLGKRVNGFDKELSEKWDQWMRKQGYDGAVLYDTEISKTVPEEVVKLAPEGSTGRRPVFEGGGSNETHSRVGTKVTVDLPTMDKPVTGIVERRELKSIKPSQSGEDLYNDTSRGYANGDIVDNLFTSQEKPRNVGKLTDPEKLPPIIVDEAGNIVDGNHRWAAAEMAGLKEIDVIVIKSKAKKEAFEKAAKEQGKNFRIPSEK